MKSHSTILSTALIGFGVLGMVVMSHGLHENKEIDVPLNVLGIKRSPYGEVIAMAMQGPIDSYWGVVEGRGNPESDSSENRQLDHLKSQQQRAIYDYTSWNDRLRLMLEELAMGLEERTNAFAASDAHKFYLRRKIEKKLRFAYELDPAHYGNYNAYHFFLTEPQVGTRPVLTQEAAYLADQTIQYCMSRRVDPREALTAAAAAGNILELMLNDYNANQDKPSQFNHAQMRVVLQVMDQAIRLYLQMAENWIEQDLWINLSEHRINEANERFVFIKKIRASHESAIRLIEGDSQESDLSDR